MSFVHKGAQLVKLAQFLKAILIMSASEFSQIAMPRTSRVAKIEFVIFKYCFVIPYKYFNQGLYFQYSFEGDKDIQALS